MISKSDGLILQNLRNAIRVIPNFPKSGITFYDIMPILQNSKLFSHLMEQFTKDYFAGDDIKDHPTKIVSIESRGFILGAALSVYMKCGFVPIRKSGKLPHTVNSVDYSLEYGIGRLEMHTDAIEEGDRVILIDDVLATGGTANAASSLIRASGGEILKAYFFLELEALKGREQIKGYIRDRTVSILKF